MACMGPSDAPQTQIRRHLRLLAPNAVSLLNMIHRSVLTILNRVVAATLIRLHYLTKVIGSKDHFLADVTAFICTQVAMHYGVMATSIPCLKPFIIQFNTGWTVGDGSGYAMTSMNKSSRNRPGQRSSRIGDHQDGGEGGLRPDGVSNATNITSALRQAVHPRGTIRSSSSEDMIIHRTVDYQVHIDDAPPVEQRSEANDSLDDQY